MKLLFAARMSAPWLITAIARLAAHLTRWSVFHDRALRRLMSFVKHNTHLTLTSQLAPRDLATAELHLWCDADHAGDHSTSKSTSGMFLALVSSDLQRTWPLSWYSRKQTATSSSTCEAETISISSGLRKEAIPMLSLVEQLLGRPVLLVCHEDNEATIISIRKGYSPALRHLARTVRTSIGFTHEVFFPDPEDVDSDGEAPSNFEVQPVLRHCDTTSMRADVFTKALKPPDFAIALALLNCKEVIK